MPQRPRGHVLPLLHHHELQSRLPSPESGGTREYSPGVGVRASGSSSRSEKRLFPAQVPAEDGGARHWSPCKADGPAWAFQLPLRSRHGCVMFNVLTSTQPGDVHFDNIIHVIQPRIDNIIISTGPQHTATMRYFASLRNLGCILCLQHCHLGQDAFQVLSSHRRPMATVLDGVVLDPRPGQDGCESNPGSP